MLEELFQYYKSNISTNALIFQHMKKDNLVVKIILSISGILWYLMILAVPTIIINYFYFLILVFLIFCCLGITVRLVFLHSQKVTLIIYSLYHIESFEGLWKNPDFNHMQATLLIKYLKSKGMYHKDSISSLINQVTKEIDRRSPPKILASGVFLVFFAPAWLQYVLYLFNSVKDLGLGSVTFLLILCVICATFFAICVGGFKMLIFLLQSVGIFGIQSEVEEMRQFLEQIEDIYLRIDHTLSSV